MFSLSFPVLQAFESELRAQFKEYAKKNHYDAHTYTIKSIKLRAAKAKNPKWVAILELNMDIVLQEMDDGIFEDTYDFKYGIGSDYSLGRYDPDVPLSQQQVFQAYDTWGEALAAWTKTIYNFFVARRAALAPVHEELIAKAWHPDRVASLLERGGWEAVDAVC